MMLIPVGALLLAIAFTVHLWLQKQAEEDVQRKRADEALAAAFEPLRRQENPVPARTAAAPTPAPTPTAVSPRPVAQNAGKPLPNVSPAVAGDGTARDLNREPGSPGPTPGNAEKGLAANSTPTAVPAPTASPE